ncbi:MAG TPA: GDSL-type esterase/lipase family protein [Nitrospirales bacterium]|nr:GDSL-type esterase/lipase family protein [Nitrospirales bacterium]
MTDVPLIICFGDSLTAGYQSGPGGIVETPYGAFLQDRFGRRARVLVRGICGELTGEMVLRFRADVLTDKPAWVLILGGTNDLGCNAAPEEIMRNLVKMYEQARAAGIRVGAVTVPSIRVEASTADERAWVAEHLDRRDALNGLIRRYCTERGAACLDLFGTTAEPETRQLAARFSNDGLHLSTAGYQTLADLAYAALAPHWPDKH